MDASRAPDGIFSQPGDPNRRRRICREVAVQSHLGAPSCSDRSLAQASPDWQPAPFPVSQPVVEVVLDAPLMDEIWKTKLRWLENRLFLPNPGAPLREKMCCWHGSLSAVGTASFLPLTL